MKIFLLYLVLLKLICLEAASFSSQYQLLASLYPERQLNVSADFGSAATIGSSFVAIGAQNNHNESGSVFLFDPNGNASEVISQINAPPTFSKGANFGCALQACGETLVIGAQYDGVEQEGAVVIYSIQRNHTGLDAQMITVLKAPVEYRSALFFGGSLHLTCDAATGVQTLIIGAAAGAGQGAMFMTSRKNSDQLWSPVNLLSKAPKSLIGANYGQSVASDGQSFGLVGANHAGEDNSTGTVFLIPFGTNPEEAEIEFKPPEHVKAGSYFGTVVSVAPAQSYEINSKKILNSPNNKPLVVISAPWALNGTGLVMIYSSQGELLSEIPTPPELDGWSNFGITLDFLSESCLAIGAWGGNSTGLVYIYNIPEHPSETSPPHLVEVISPPSSSEPIFFGSSLGSSVSSSILSNNGITQEASLDLGHLGPELSKGQDTSVLLAIGASGDGSGDRGEAFLYKITI